MSRKLTNCLTSPSDLFTWRIKRYINLRWLDRLQPVLQLMNILYHAIGGGESSKETWWSLVQGKVAESGALQHVGDCWPWYCAIFSLIRKPVKIFIGNVAPEATSSDLRKVFEGTGLEIQKCDKVVLALPLPYPKLRMPKLICLHISKGGRKRHRLCSCVLQ